MEKPDACENCCYWEKPRFGEVGGVGLCHRYPPLHAFDLKQPKTNAHDWCGEFTIIENDNGPI